jgi:hypothetical protein
MKHTIEQIERQGAQQLDAPVRKFLQDYYPDPQGRRLTISLLDDSGRKKRCSASPENWSPESGEIRIRFEPADSSQVLVETGNGKEGSASGGQNTAANPSTEVESLECDAARLLRQNNEKLAKILDALDRAEGTPGWNFVPLRKFRDEMLPGDFPSPEERHALLDLAIKRRFVLVGKVPNPKAPQFPVTTVRLNRLMPEVKAMLGQPEDEEMDFHPVEILGEPMSATIIRERRQQ